MRLNSQQKLLFFTIIIPVITLLIVGTLNLFGIFTTLESKSYDFKINLTAKSQNVSDDICFIGIDQESINQALEERGWSWPWPRSAYSEIVDFMNEGGAQAVVFDVFFTDPSVYGQEDDFTFAESSKNYGRVIQTMHTDKGELIFPVEPIMDSSKMLANITSIKDSDEIIRRARFSFSANGVEYPALGIAPLLIDSESSEDIQQQLNEIRNEIPLQEDNSVLLRYKGSIDRYAHYPAWEIIKSWEDYRAGKETYLVPEDFEDCIVYFIFYAPGLYDICSTPVSQFYPGAGVHITMLDNYLTESFLKDASIIVKMIYCILLAFAASFSVYFMERKSGKIKTILLTLNLFVSALVIAAFSIIHLWFNINLFFVVPLFVYEGCYIFTLIMSYSVEGSQKKFIKNAFSQYLSPDVINGLLLNPEKLTLGGEKKNISIFFSDIQGFSTISEGLSPEKLTALLNKYLSAMTDKILESGGTIDKYEGDAIIAFWNAPLDVPNHQKTAVETALKCQAILEEMKVQFSEICGRPLWTRIGLNSGEAVVGNMGSSKRFDYTMFGDSVNLASRLEGLNKQFGTYTMVSQNIRDNAVSQGTDLYFRELAKVTVVGKNEVITVYEPVEHEKYLQNKEMYDRFNKALYMFYEGKAEEALPIFLELEKSDSASHKYSMNCQLLIEDKTLPRDGIYHAMEK